MQEAVGVRKEFPYFLLMAFLLTAVPFLEAGLVIAFLPKNPTFLFRDYYLQTFLACAVLLSVVFRTTPLQLGIQKRYLALNLTSLLAMVVLHSLRHSAYLKGNPLLFGLALLKPAFILLSTSPFVFLKPVDHLKIIKQFSPEAIFALLAATSQGFYHVLNHHCWQVLAGPTTCLVTGFLKFLGYPMMPAPAWNMIQHPLFRVKIAPVCDGLEGVFFFIFVASLILILDCRQFSKKAWAAIFVSGILFFLILNVLRITTFFAFAVWMTEQWGRSVSAKWTIWAFHSHAGWIFYVLGMFLFFAVFYALSKKSTTSSESAFGEH